MNRHSLPSSHSLLPVSTAWRFALSFSLICIVLLLSGKTAVAGLIFLDTFNVSAQTTNLSFENTIRQSGPAAPVAYLQEWVNQNGLTVDPAWWQLGVPGYEGSLYLNGVGNPNGPGGVGVSTTPNHSFVESTNFIVDFDITPFSDPSAGGWAGIKILDSKIMNPS